MAKKSIKRKFPKVMKNLRAMSALIPDKSYINWQAKRYLGYKVNWDNPQTFNEKLLWMKVNWEGGEGATQCADKYMVREFVEKTIGSQYLNELYAVYDDVDAIDVINLPDTCAMKLTHGSGYNIIYKNKQDVDWTQAKKKMKLWFATDYSKGNREWVYKDVKPRIVCEKHLGDDLIDYKFFCFNGEPKMCFVCTDRDTEVKADFYDLQWNKLPIEWAYPNSDYKLEKPSKYDEMIILAKKLSGKFPFSRIDFYQVEDQVIFGEITFFHGSGLGAFKEKHMDELLGSYIRLY